MKTTNLCSLVALAFSTVFVGVLAAQQPTEPPPPTPLRPLEFPAFHEGRLDNGLEMFVVENSRLPVVSISLSLQAGSRYDPMGLEGLADMTAGLLTKGTTSRSAEQIAEEIESVGSSLAANTGNDFFSISTTVLTDHVDMAFKLMTDVLLNSTFPESEVELFRTRTLSGLQLEKSDPGALATRFFAREVYGDHPYGHRATDVTVAAISRGNVQEFARTRLVPDGALLVVSGDISADRVTQLANRHLGEWSGSGQMASHASPPRPAPTDILLVHRPGSDQSNIRVGNLALRPGADTYYAAVVANKILGGGVDARLFMTLREEKSWTYGAYSRISRRKDVGFFQANTEVRTEVTDSALTELMSQLRRMRDEAATEAELTAAKGFLVGSFPLRIQTPQQIASQVANARLLGLSEDYLQTYRERLSAVAADQAQHAAQEVIRPDSAVIVVVGDGQAIYEKLTAIAPVRIIDIEGNPLTPDDLAPEPVAIDFDLSQITTLRDSFQITFQGNPIGSQISEVVAGSDALEFRQETQIAMMGMSQTATIEADPTSLAPRKINEVVQMGGMTAETHIVYDGLHATGQAQEPDQQQGEVKTVQVDTTLVEGTIDGDMLPLLLPAFPLAEGASFTVHSFQSSADKVNVLTVKVAGVEDVTVPAGTFSTYRIEVTGGEQPVTFFITRDTPRKIVKLELMTQPVAFELVKGT